MSNMSLEVRTQVRMAQWQNIIQECKNSGMTVSDFCEKRNLSWHAYYYWLRKIREYLSESNNGGADEKLYLGKTLKGVLCNYTCCAILRTSPNGGSRYLSCFMI